MNRIRVKDLEEAYLHNGFGICFDKFISRNSGCAISHVICKDINTSLDGLDEYSIQTLANRRYNTYYVAGFTRGFDKVELMISKSFKGKDKTHYIIGYIDGKQCRKWVLGQQKEVETPIKDKEYVSL